MKVSQHTTWDSKLCGPMALSWFRLPAVTASRSPKRQILRKHAASSDAAATFPSDVNACCHSSESDISHSVGQHIEQTEPFPKPRKGGNASSRGPTTKTRRPRATPSRRKPGETRGRPRKHPIQPPAELNSSSVLFVEGGKAPGEDVPLEEGKDHTELIVKLERRGDGWGEEIIPSIKVERRPIEPLASVRHRAAMETSRNSAAVTATVDLSEASMAAQMVIEENDGFAYLVKVGVPEEEVQDLVVSATSWRVTPEGRALIDRRRQSRLARNVKVVAEHLRDECGVPFGINGVGAVFRQCPDLMLCKPTSNDRWDRRAVELAAFRLRHGHCNVPEEWPENPELSIWVARQRVARASGQLTSERVQILQRLGFEFGDLAQITEEWEQRFDQLIDWMLWHGENNQTFSWIGIDWGERGGVTAREVALWMALQREFRRRRLLPEEAEQRFAAIGVQWDSPQARSAESCWIEWFGRLLYVVQKRCIDRRGIQVKPKFGRPSQRLGQKMKSTLDDQEDSSSEENLRQMKSSILQRATRNSKATTLDLEAFERKQALAAAPPFEEPGLSFWIARQRWLWRQRRLTMEQVRMLHLAGVDMDIYSPTEWQVVAHTAAAVVRGSKITLGVSASALNGQSLVSNKTLGCDNLAKEGQKQDVKAIDRSSRNTVSIFQKSVTNPALPSSVSPGSLRLRVRRWVQTQQALFAEGRLSPPQLRYLSFLGITWMLSDAVLAMSNSEWTQLFEAWKAGLDCPSSMDEESSLPEVSRLKNRINAQKRSNSGKKHAAMERVEQWLEHQKGLHAVGLLSQEKVAVLNAAGINWEFARKEDDEAWDIRLSQLLEHSIETGSLDITADNERFEGLASWLLARQMEMSKANGGKTLSHGRIMQLKALGVQPVYASEESFPEHGVERYATHRQG